MKKTPFIVLIITLILVLSSSAYFIYKFRNDNRSLNTALKELNEKLASTTESLLFTQNDNDNLKEALEAEQQRNKDFENQIKDISSTVGVLDKLQRTDPELLQKYSKIYFLNEHYTPEKISEIPLEYLAPNKKEILLESRVLNYLEKMFKAAERDGINLLVISGYRSYFDQQSLKSAYSVSYGSGANTFSADQGYSEHQLGTTVDLTTKELGLGYTKIETTKAYEWLNKNAYKYGFVLSYPKGNKYYIFEPWHWRFVGKDLAEKLHDEEKYFYDLDQREIDKYLVNFFD